MKRQSGFTLVEIAIVLVVIGLLLGGVLKGQELVLNARIRNAINEYNSIASASFAYQDRYRQIPGDDNTANARWAAQAPAIQDGNSNGIIEGTTNYNTGAGIAGGGGIAESTEFWRHLRNDRLVTGNLNSAVAPPNSFDGITGVEDTIFAAPPNGIVGPVICHSNVPFKPATIIEQRLDDGASDTGTLMAAQDNGGLAGGLPGTAAANYVDGNRYALCRQL